MMHPIVLLTVALAVLSNAMPQTEPSAPGNGELAQGPPPAKGGKGGVFGKAGKGGKLGKGGKGAKFGKGGKGAMFGKGAKGGKGAKSGKGGKVNTSALMAGVNNLLRGKQAGTDGPDLRGIAEFLKIPSIPTMFGGALSFLGPLFKIPDIQKYGASYLDFRNISQLPFVVNMPMGPVPAPGCFQYELIMARGTGEVGVYGFIVGDPLLKYVRKVLPDVQGYSVQYPANMEPNSSSIGATDVINRLQKQSKACPNQKFAIVGYSQGSMVVRSALRDAGKVGESVFKQIVGGATFGDPAGRPKGAPPIAMPGMGIAPKGATPKGTAPTAPKGTESTTPKGTAPTAMPGVSGAPTSATPKGPAPKGAGPFAVPKGAIPLSAPRFALDLEEKVKVYCAKGDPICTPNSQDVIAHLTYNNPDVHMVQDAAGWIVARFKGDPFPKAV